jgi:CxxC motif-containing protein (DUF1111 family)
MNKTAKLTPSTASALIFFAGMTFSQMAFAQTTTPPPAAAVAIDPGVQSGTRGTGTAGPGGGAGQNIITPTNDPNGFGPFWGDGLGRFKEVFEVTGSTTGDNGLGPRFNSNGCATCHSQPAVGGTGGAVNPQASFSTNGVAPGSTTPFFITASGPTREARFPFFFTDSTATAVSTTPNGGVEDIFTVSGRPDAGSCELPQPPFAAAKAANNIIFRIPTPTFGLGMVENLDDSTLLKNQLANQSNSFGISGTFNHNGNDGTISRFGWKAQNKSLEIFAGEATNVEMGVTNLVFPNERPLPEEDMLPDTGLPTTCLNLTGTGYPEDKLVPLATTNATVLDDVAAFADFMRFNAPPVTGGVLLNGVPVTAASIAAGSGLFVSIGCSTCHSPSPGTTQVSNLVPQLSSVPVNAFSDFEIHDMGTTLADNVSQGTAGGDQFRTAPLWGLGQRIFLLHDGRETDLRAAIVDHASSGSEASTVVESFQDLNATQKQDLFNFLRSL